MRPERTLKIVLVLVGLLFCAAIYPLLLMLKQDPALAMMMSLYATLGIFWLLASRNPSAHRSLIAVTAWSSFAHATVMGVVRKNSSVTRKIRKLQGFWVLSPDPEGSPSAFSIQRLIR